MYSSPNTYTDLMAQILTYPTGYVTCVYPIIFIITYLLHFTNCEGSSVRIVKWSADTETVENNDFACQNTVSQLCLFRKFMVKVRNVPRNNMLSSLVLFD